MHVTHFKDVRIRIFYRTRTNDRLIESLPSVALLQQKQLRETEQGIGALQKSHI